MTAGFGVGEWMNMEIHPGSEGGFFCPLTGEFFDGGHDFPLAGETVQGLLRKDQLAIDFHLENPAT